MGSGSATAADAVRELCEKLILPTSPESIGVGAERFRSPSTRFRDGSIRGNPRPIKNPEDIEEILNLAR